MPRSILYVCVLVCIAWRLTHVESADCKNCGTRQIVNLDSDFSKLAKDPKLSKYVANVLARLKTFKVPVHPRIRIFYELLKLGMRDYADRTADSLYVPEKYNIGTHAVSNKDKTGRHEDDTAQNTSTVSNISSLTSRATKLQII